jgi:hypothetical protein
LEGEYYLQPGQEDYPMSYQGNREPNLPDPAIYGSNKPWPGVYYTGPITQSKRGFQLHFVKLLPVQYRPKSGRVSYAEKMRLTIKLKDKTTGVIFRPSRDLEADVARQVDNPAALSTYPSRSIPESGTQDRAGALALEGGPYEYVIITSQELLDTTPEPWNFQRLRDSKTARGISATIVTTDWIYDNYDGDRPDGDEDDQTRIRNFLIDAYENWQTEYVLLAGDKDIIPVRDLYALMPVSSNYMPSDMYYGCVYDARGESTFDYDEDGAYGEQTDGPNGEDVDLCADIYVGRAAVENGQEVNNFVKKTLTYNSTVSTYLPRISMIGQSISCGGWAKDDLEYVRLGTSTTKGFENHESPDFYDFDTSVNLYDADCNWSTADLISVMNNGIHVLNHLGHGGTASWGSQRCEGSVKKFRTDDISSLTNTDCFFAASAACLCGDFNSIDSDCLAEELTVATNGAFAAVMNSTGAPTTGSINLNRRFWDKVLGSGVTELGRALQESKEAYFFGDSGGRSSVYMLNLFGDPEQQLLFGQERDSAWLEAQPVSGTIGDGASTVIDADFSVGILPGGTYEGEILIRSNDPESPSLSIPVTMRVLAFVTPYDDFETVRAAHDPGATGINWTASKTQDWLDVTPSAGYLDAETWVDVNVCVNANAYELPVGTYYDTVTFTDTTNNKVQEREVTVKVRRGDYFTELFDFDNDVDIDNQTLTFYPDGSLAHYTVCREMATVFPTDPEDGEPCSPYSGEWYAWGHIDLGEDAVSLYGTSYDYVYVAGNGLLTFEPDSQKRNLLLSDISLNNHFSSPSISGLHTLLAPWNGGTISYKKLTDRVAVTFEDVPDYYSENNLNSFQVELFFDGRIRITHLDVNLYGPTVKGGVPAIVGLSEGNGTPEDFVESDLSAYGSACPPVHNITQELWYYEIQPALDGAQNSDVIEVYPGTYYESIDFGGVSCMLTSTDPDDWDVVAQTTIDVDGVSGGVGVRFGTGEDATLSGLTIRGGQWGVAVFNSSTPTISKCIIEQNDIGVYGLATAPKIEHNIFVGNSYHGIAIAGSLAKEIENNWIYDNGRGIYLMAPGLATVVRNNTIVNNSIAGIESTFNTPTIENCIVWDCNDDLSNCTASYSCISDCNDAAGTGNICGDANDPSFIDADNGDYHLDANSPCIDAGDPNGDYGNETDIDGEPRAMGDCNQIVDMGADEVYYPSCWNCLTQCHGDADCSGTVNSTDQAAVTAALFESYGDPNYNPCADFDKDGNVNFTDLGILTVYYDTSPDPNCDCGGTWPPQ